MNRHLLLATDGSTFARKALQYLAVLFQNREDIEITVLTVAPGAPSYLASPNPAIEEITRQERVEKIERQNFIKAQGIVEEALATLEKAGFPRERLHSKVQIKQGDLAHHILREAHIGKYDAVVVGRRGLGRLASAWMGSVSQKLVEYGKGLPIWVIAGKEWNKRFLVAIEIGKPGLKVVDHLSFILSRDPEVEIVLFHVLTGFFPETRERDLEGIQELLLEAQKGEAASFFKEVQEMLSAEGLDPARISVKIKTSAFGPAGAIIKEARDGGYGTVVVGRRGRGGFKELLLGSVSSKVLSHLNQRTIWVVG